MLRAIYVVLLCLHPRNFRREFAEEMLWIFDRTTSPGRSFALVGALVGDALRSLVTQWMFREFEDVPQPAADRVPMFYTSESDMPPPSALLNGLIGSVALFALASFALAHSGGQRRVFTYYGSDFHAGPSTAGDTTPGPPAATSRTGFWATLSSQFGKSSGKSAEETPGASERQPSPVSSARVYGGGLVSGSEAPVLPKPAAELIYFHAVPVLSAIDTDQDGELSVEEIAHASAALSTLDKNHDGKLDPEECGFGPRHSPSVEQETYLLMAYDRNHDGKLQRSELPFDIQRMFRQFDANHDGELSADEIGNLAQSRSAARLAEIQRTSRRAGVDFMRVEPVLAALDTDHNGQLSSSEIGNAPPALKAMDRNHDGRLTLDEVRRNPLGNEMAAIFRLDTDFDGKISPLERKGQFGQYVKPLLDAADRNHDGTVTWEELEREIRNRADTNHDGVVTVEEMMQARRSGLLYGPSRRELPGNKGCASEFKDSAGPPCSKPDRLPNATTTLPPSAR